MNENSQFFPKTKSPHSILLVEDNEDDIYLIKRIFGKLEVSFSANFVRDGEEAIDYLRHPDKTIHPIPLWIITDIKMPKIDGLEFLNWVKSSDARRLPVVVLSSSGQKEDIFAAYKAGACGYFVKPSHFNDLVEVWRTISSYWSSAKHP